MEALGRLNPGPPKVVPDHRAQCTLQSWRNLWFHTGDAAAIYEDGYMTFLDRIKDRIRRRGDNVSYFEIEPAMSRPRGVADVVALAVPSGIAGVPDGERPEAMAASGQLRVNFGGRPPSGRTGWGPHRREDDRYPRCTPQNSGNIDFTMSLMSERNAVG